MVEEKIKKGYKRTEVGIIPEDWYFSTLGDNISEMTDFVAAGSFEALRVNVNTYDSPNYAIYVRLFDLRLGLGHTAQKYVDKKSYDFLSKSNLFGNEILIANIGANVGEVFLMPENVGPATVAPNMIIIRTDNKKARYDYLFNYMKSDIGKEKLNELTSGSGQPKINKTDLKKLKLIIPPIPEQKDIAEALLDIDNFLQSLEKLVDKKKKIKQGTMQQLLTGKKRLPGFSGEWEDTCIKDLLDYEQPTKYIIKSDLLEKGTNPVLTANKSFILGFTEENFGVYENLPVIIFDDFTTLSKKVSFKFKVKSSAMKMLKAKNENINLEFLYEIMQLIKFTLGDHKRYYLSEYQYIEIKLPNIEEQNAIANILSDIDFEIEALQQKLKKYKKIKQGMMQELLTGRIRLV